MDYDPLNKMGTPESMHTRMNKWEGRKLFLTVGLLTDKFRI